MSTWLFWPSLLSQLSTSHILTWKFSCYVVLQLGSWGESIWWVMQVPWVHQSIWLPSRWAVHPLSEGNYFYSCNINVGAGDGMCDCKAMQEPCAIYNIITWAGWLEIEGSPHLQGLGYKEKKHEEKKSLLVCASPRANKTLKNAATFFS